jgi:hypothetical protein
MYRIKRFNVLKTSTVVAVIYMVIVAIFVVPFVLLLAIAGTGSQVQGGLGAALALGVVAIFGYGLLGWVFTAIGCLIYNLVAGWIGGIEVHVEAVVPSQPPPAWLSPDATPPPAPPSPPAPPTTPPAV